MSRPALVSFAATLCAWTFLSSCSSDEPSENTPASGGNVSSGGSTSGGAVSTGGDLSGGSSSGGTASGGETSSGGEASTGGGDTGGAAAGTGGELGTGGASETLESGLPKLLSQTGLYEADMTTLGPGVRSFEPRFPLWTDGAAKHRWVRLPEDSQIDTTDMNYWTYPVGTTLWKEFVRDGVRVETRILQKMTSRRWAMVAYLWNEDLTEAVASVEGVSNASGTEHDVPSEEQCWECHNRMPDSPLGFIAVQLAHEGSPNNTGDPEWTLAQLAEEGMLTTTPPTTLDIPGTDVEKTALEYLQGNCAHCHHPETTLSRVQDMSFQLDVNLLGGDVTELPAYKTAVGVAANLKETGVLAEYRIAPDGNATESAALVRYLEIGTEAAMPPLGTEIVDPAGKDALEAWIASLAP